MSDAPLPADQAPGAPHPCTCETLIGQDAAENTFLQAHSSGRLHHGWLLTGPKGIGKGHARMADCAVSDRHPCAR